MIKTLILAAVLTGAAATPVLAGEASDYHWTGWYGGFNAGIGGDKFRYPFEGSGSTGSGSATFSGKAQLTSSGALGGVQLGYNYLYDTGVLVGIEGDFNASGIKGQLSAAGGGTGSSSSSGMETLSSSSSSGSLDIAAKAGSDLKSLGTVRFRVGRVLSNGVLIYGTAGWAFSNVDSHANIGIGGLATLGAEIRKKGHPNGWAAGAGVEYPISDRWTFRAEYLHANLGHYTLFNDDVSLLGISGHLNARAEPRVNMVRVVVNYRFGA